MHDLDAVKWRTVRTEEPVPYEGPMAFSCKISMALSVYSGGAFCYNIENLNESGLWKGDFAAKVT